MARILDRLVGHRERLAPLFRAHAKGRLASALLFSGPSGVGKRLAARALAQALVCERVSDEGEACGACGPCLRVEKSQSESLMELGPDGAALKIEQARDVLQFISLQKLGRARVVILDQAQLFNPQAANALLKSLEEPPSGTYFILITSAAGAILPTIRSRTQLVRFRPLSPAELAHVLGPEADAWVVESAQGSVEVAERLASSREEFQELESALATYVAAVASRFPIEEAARLKELTKDRAAQGFVATWIESLVRDALRVRAGLKPLGGGVWEKTSETWLGLKADRLSDIAEASFQLETDLARNIDRGLAFENFSLLLKSGRHGHVD